jgi:hypothetical protein
LILNFENTMRGAVPVKYIRTNEQAHSGESSRQTTDCGAPSEDSIIFRPLPGKNDGGADDLSSGGFVRVVIGEKAWKTERVSVTWIPLPVRFLKWVAFGVPLRRPRALETRPEVHQERGGTSPRDLETDRNELLRLLDRFTRQPRDFEWQPHPMFGLMADAD